MGLMTVVIPQMKTSVVSERTGYSSVQTMCEVRSIFPSWAPSTLGMVAKIPGTC